MRRKNKIIPVIAAALVFVVTVTGIAVLSRSDQKENENNLVDLNEVAQNEDTDTTTNEENETKTAKNTTDEDESFGMDNVMDATDEYIGEGDTDDEANEQFAETEDTQEENEDEEIDTQTASAEEQQVEDTQTEPEVQEAASSSVSNVVINFTDTDKLTWPINGNVILNYSMDSTVYFATLNQYKYNSALIIQANVNDKVLSAANGTVKDIYVDEETGNTLSVDLGNGYTAIYGQLKDVSVQIGDTIEKGSTIAYISEPSKYYSVEGSNLYFKLTKNDEPVNPLNYLE